MVSQCEKFFHSFDLFAYMPCLRIRRQGDVGSGCGGVTSLLVMVFFIYVFIIDVVDLANFGKVQAIQTTEYSLGSQDYIDDFMFAIGIQGITLDQYQEYFNIEASLKVEDEFNSSEIPVNLIPCEQEMWVDTDGQPLSQAFKQNNMKDMLCLNPNQNVTIKGQQNSNLYQYLHVKVSECSNETDIGCRTETKVEKFLTRQKKQNKYLIGKFLFLNTGFNMKNQKPQVKYVQDKIWLIFSEKEATQAFIQLGRYEIQTDTSIWPIQQQQLRKGSYLVNYNKVSFLKGPYDGLISAQISLSSEKKVFSRNFGKVDDRLSYIGGLFEIVIIFLSFFMNSYNMYRYQLMVSEKIYSDTSGNKAKQKNFNFLSYVKYSLYSWLELILCCPLGWKECTQITEAREEANQQMDIEKLLRRINHNQEVNKLLICEKEEKALYLRNPRTLQEHRKRRKYEEYYDHMVENETPITIQNFKQKIEITDLSSIQNLEQIEQHQKDDSNIFQMIFKRSGRVAQNQPELPKETKEVQEQLLNAYQLINGKIKSQLFSNIPLQILQRMKTKEKFNEKEKTDTSSFLQMKVKKSKPKKINWK